MDLTWFNLVQHCRLQHLIKWGLENPEEKTRQFQWNSFSAYSKRILYNRQRPSPKENTYNFEQTYRYFFITRAFDGDGLKSIDEFSWTNTTQELGKSYTYRLFIHTGMKAALSVHRWSTQLWITYNTIWLEDGGFHYLLVPTSRERRTIIVNIGGEEVFIPNWYVHFRSHQNTRRLT
jgi:hypothetical protein